MLLPRAALEPAPDPKASVRIRSSAAAPEGPDGAPTATHEVNVIGQRLPEAISEVEKSLDDALLRGAGRLRVVHGHGTGRLRAGLREHLRQHPSVAALRAADAREGGDGATIVELK